MIDLLERIVAGFMSKLCWDEEEEMIWAEERS